MDVPLAGAPAHDSRRQRSFYCAKAYLLIPFLASHEFVNPKGPRRELPSLCAFVDVAGSGRRSRTRRNEYEHRRCLCLRMIRSGLTTFRSTKTKLKTQKGEDVASAKSESKAEDVAHRLNEQAQREEDDRWSA
jgi:hypothetical protein